MFAGSELDTRIDALRADTPGTSRVRHFNHAGASLPPKPVIDAVTDQFMLESTIGGYEAFDDAADRLEAVYASIGRLVHASPEEIGLVENATRAWDMAVYAIPFQRGDRALTASPEYASNLIGLLQLAKRFDLEIEVVPNDATGQIDLDALDAALTRPARAVFISHMPTNGGLVQPAEEIGAIIRRRQPETWYVLDACQTTGQLPIDVERLQCDVLSATSRKYLRGPRGAGFLYARRERIPEMTPPLLDLHAAQLTSATDYRIRNDARRFENWESYVAGRLGMGVAADYALEIGLDAIWDRVQRQAARLRDRLAAVDGVTVHDQGSVRGGIVTFSRAGVPSPVILRTLRDQGINTSLSNTYTTYLQPRLEAVGTTVRSSVHYLTTDDEIDALIEAIPTHA